jgi:hypothetical protein
MFIIDAFKAILGIPVALAAALFGFFGMIFGL